MSLAERREQNFKAKIEKDRDGIYLGVTHNGHQWTLVELNHREMAIVKEVLRKELEVHVKELIEQNNN